MFENLAEAAGTWCRIHDVARSVIFLVGGVAITGVFGLLVPLPGPFSSASRVVRATYTK